MRAPQIALTLAIGLVFAACAGPADRAQEVAETYVVASWNDDYETRWEVSATAQNSADTVEEYIAEREESAERLDLTTTTDPLDPGQHHLESVVESQGERSFGRAFWVVRVQHTHPGEPERLMNRLITVEEFEGVLLVTETSDLPSTITQEVNR